MKKAFSYMFSDNGFCKKAFLFLIYTVLLLYCSNFSLTHSGGKIVLNLYNYLFVFLVFIFGCSISEGYKIAIIKSLDEENKKFVILPILNLKKNFILGFKYLISILCFSMPFLCVTGALGFVVGYASVLNMPSILINTASILIILLLLVYSIYLLAFLPASIQVFAKTSSIWSFYKFEDVFQLIFVDFKKYIKLALLYFVLGILIEEVYRISLILNNQTGLFLLSLVLLSAIITYTHFVMSYIIASIGKVEKNN